MFYHLFRWIPLFAGDVENLSARPCQLDAKNTELEHYLTDQSAAKQASGSSRDESSLFQEGNNRIENQVHMKLPTIAWKVNEYYYHICCQNFASQQ